MDEIRFGRLTLIDHDDCERCDGTGIITHPAGAPGNMSNFLDAEEECPACEGTGHDFRECRYCEAEARHEWNQEH